MEKIIVLLSLLVSAAYCKEYTPVLQCGGEKLFKNVAISTPQGVCTKLPCKFKIGDTLTAEIEFENKDVVEKITSKCVAKVLGNDVTFPIPNADKGCDYLVNTKCPVKPKSNIIIKLDVPVKTPSSSLQNAESKLEIPVRLQFSLHDQKDQMISCFIVTAKVDV